MPRYITCARRYERSSVAHSTKYFGYALVKYLTQHLDYVIAKYLGEGSLVWLGQLYAFAKYFGRKSLGMACRNTQWKYVGHAFAKHLGDRSCLCHGEVPWQHNAYVLAKHNGHALGQYLRKIIWLCLAEIPFGDALAKYLGLGEILGFCLGENVDAKTVDGCTALIPASRN